MNFCTSCGARFANSAVKFCTSCGQARALDTGDTHQLADDALPDPPTVEPADQGVSSTAIQTRRSTPQADSSIPRRLPVAVAAVFIGVLGIAIIVGLAMANRPQSGTTGTATTSSAEPRSTVPPQEPTYEAPADDALPSTIGCAGQLSGGQGLSWGDNGPDVSALQWGLESLRYETQNESGVLLPVTGSFDTTTADAVRRFQTNHDLPATGYVDEATWAKLAVQLRTWGGNPPCS